MKKKIYYNNLEDELCYENVKHVVIDENYKYLKKNWLYKFFSAIYYRLIIFPIAFVYSKLICKVKIVNKKCLKKFKHKPLFIFANHTHNILDAFNPSMVFKSQKPYILVNSANLNIPILKGSTKMLGAVPVPDTLSATKNFMEYMEILINKKRKIIIYPEAHVWQYYTKIRPFKSTSFKYPVKFNTPVFCITTTYQKTKNPHKCKIVLYIDGPFEINHDLSKKEQQEDLRNRVYNQMCERAKNSNYEKFEYIQRSNTND